MRRQLCTCSISPSRRVVSASSTSPRWLPSTTALSFTPRRHFTRSIPSPADAVSSLATSDQGFDSEGKSAEAEAESRNIRRMSPAQRKKYFEDRYQLWLKDAGPVGGARFRLGGVKKDARGNIVPGPNWLGGDRPFPLNPSFRPPPPLSHSTLYLIARYYLVLVHNYSHPFPESQYPLPDLEAKIKEDEEASKKVPGVSGMDDEGVESGINEMRKEMETQEKGREEERAAAEDGILRQPTKEFDQTAKSGGEAKAQGKGDQEGVENGAQLSSSDANDKAEVVEEVEVEPKSLPAWRSNRGTSKFDWDGTKDEGDGSSAASASSSTSTSGQSSPSSSIPSTSGGSSSSSSGGGPSRSFSTSQSRRSTQTSVDSNSHENIDILLSSSWALNPASSSSRAPPSFDSSSTSNENLSYLRVQQSRAAANLGNLTPEIWMRSLERRASRETGKRFGISMERVFAIVKLIREERRLKNEGKPLQTAFRDGMEANLNVITHGKHLRALRSSEDPPSQGSERKALPQNFMQEPNSKFDDISLEGMGRRHGSWEMRDPEAKTSQQEAGSFSVSPNKLFNPDFPLQRRIPTAQDLSAQVEDSGTTTFITPDREGRPAWKFIDVSGTEQGKAWEKTWAVGEQGKRKEKKRKRRDAERKKKERLETGRRGIERGVLPQVVAKEGENVGI